MLEYKREKATLEAQLKDAQKRSADHDDHLRIIDAWWSQVREKELSAFGTPLMASPSSSTRLDCSRRMTLQVRSMWQVRIALDPIICFDTDTKSSTVPYGFAVQK
jgi:hypothetical protein